MLQSEYGSAPLILLKDPRTCLFVEFWDEALNRAGYDPRYVLVVRPPMEVARSLKARDLMAEDRSLALWLGYSSGAEIATRKRTRTIVHYHDLLEDWRTVVARVSAQLGVDLDSTTRADEIDAFLCKDLHRQRDDSLPDTDLGRACASAYAQLRALCAADTLRGRRILVASIGLTPNGGLLRFARVARILRREGHEVAFLNLGRDTDALFAEFPILTLSAAASQKWDAVVLAGAGFPIEAMPILEQLRKPTFGKRIQAILRDQSRRDHIARALHHLKPHALLVNNRHWQDDELDELARLPTERIIGAVDTDIFKPAPGRHEVTRVGLQGKTLPDVLPLIELFPAVGEWHVFGNLPTNCSIPPHLAPRIVLRGVLNDLQLAGFYRDMDIVIAAERHAGWCNVAAEAMACGKPVICTTAGTLDFALDGHNALVVPEVATAPLQQALERLLESPELRAELGRNGPGSVARFDWPSWAHAFLDLCNR